MTGRPPGPLMSCVHRVKRRAGTAEGGSAGGRDKEPACLRDGHVVKLFPLPLLCLHQRCAHRPNECKNRANPPPAIAPLGVHGRRKCLHRPYQAKHEFVVFGRGGPWPRALVPRPVMVVLADSLPIENVKVVARHGSGALEGLGESSALCRHRWQVSLGPGYSRTGPFHSQLSFMTKNQSLFSIYHLVP